MKNALLFILAIAVAVLLGVVLYQRKHMSKEQLMINHRKDHNGSSVDTVDCPVRTGQNKKTCVIPVSYLTDMVNGWDKDYAIEVHHKDTIKWVGDSGETIEVPEMPGVLCSDHTQPDQPGGDRSLIRNISGSPGNIVSAEVTDNPKNDKYCYKNTIYVTSPGGKRTPIDPHYFSGGQ